LGGCSDVVVVVVLDAEEGSQEKDSGHGAVGGVAVTKNRSRLRSFIIHLPPAVPRLSGRLFITLAIILGTYG